jgi:hypothetical protein
MKSITIASFTFATLVSLPLSSIAAEPIKVLLSRTSTSISETTVRGTLIQMNTTMSNSGLGSLDFVSADTIGGVPVVDFVPLCSATDEILLLDCLQDALETRRNSVSADIVVTVAPTVGSLCGATPPGMIDAFTISGDNGHLAYAVLKNSCLISPSNNMKIASHEIGHLLSLEHHDDDHFPLLPQGISDNHAEEDFDDHTVMGSPKDDCISTSINCNGHDFFSEVGRTFPDGGSAGNSSTSNAKAVVSALSWSVVAAYRPLPAPTVFCYDPPLFLGCPYGCMSSPYLMSWVGQNASSFVVQKQGYFGWDNWYSGPNTSSFASTGTIYDEYFRVKAVNAAGLGSNWCQMSLRVQCSETMDPW